MRGSRSSRRAAAQRPVSYAELPLDDDFQVGKESGTDEAEVEGDSNGRSPNRSGKLQESLVRAKRAADSSLQTRSKRGGRGSGGGRGRSGGAASGCVAKKPGPRGPSLDAKVAAVADGGGDGAYKTKAGLGGTAVDGKAAATEDGDGKGDEEERKPRSERLGQGSSSEAVDGKRVSSRVRRAVDYAVDIRDKDEEREEAGEEKDRDEDSDEECEADWRPSPEKKMEDKEDGPRRRGKRSASEKSRRTSTSSDAQRNNPLLKQFGFRPGSRESSQANVDWDFAGPRVGGKSSSTGKHKKASTSRDGTSRKDGTWRRSGRTRGKRQTYAEPSSESADTVGSDSGDGGDEGVEDDGESSEDDIFEGKKKKPNGKSAKTSVKGGGGGGCKGRGQKGSKAAEAQTEDHRKRPREKPVASKPKVEGTRRSSREKPPVCYSERVVDMEVDKRRDAGVKAEGHESSDRQSMDSDVVVSRGKKSSTAGKAKRQAATSPSGTATAVSESRQKDPKRRKRSKSLSTCDDDDYGSDVDEESEEDEYDQDDGDSEEVKPKVASRTSRGDGRNKGKGRATSADYVESENSSGSEDYEDDEEEKEPLRVDKIVARKKLLPAEWRELCKDMNTAEVKAGSMWGNGSRNGGNSDDEEGEKPVEKYLIKWSGMSYLHVSWETLRDLVKNAGKMVNMKVRRFREREFDVEMELERGDGEYFDPSLTVLDRVLDVDEVEGEETRLLVKWLGAPYSECTYELVRDLENAGEDYVAAVEAYRRREDMSKLLNLKPTRKRCEGAPDLDKDPPVFKNGGALRDYQREGVRWMVFNWLHKRGSILADEMGLGKTLQTVTFLRILHVDYGIPGPFLIVAPLSTVTHWQREFQNWSDMNTVVFHGYQDDRDILDEYEMEFSEDKERKAKDKTLLRGRRIWKPTVVVTTPELCIKPDVSALLGRKIHWDVLVVDEAHRLKNNDSKLNSVLKDYFTYDSTLLLTGTPLQNNTEELWTLLNLVDPPNFKDKDGFVEMYGDLQQAEDVAHLQKNIKPYLLRRMKEDVEKAVPPKEETIIEVELTEVQKQYYRAIYEQNTTFLLQGKKRPQDGPSLMNLAMQLRKCCNHPYLIDGVEDAVRIQMGDDADSKEHLARHSGKLVLLDKLLPRLKEQGHRVLIFSQFKIMLNILEDYLIASEVSYGRIDGSIQGHVRQKAIDNFQAPNSDMLVMLLSTKAGGVGITLTAADTCIIYDSDWNPQVYRLLVAKTYEMHMFKTASKKLGLDQAVLSGSRPKKAQDKAGPTAKEVEMLLKHGAYDVFQEGGEGAEAGKKFCEDSIDAILSRATVVNHSAEGGQDGQPSNSFSKASFVSSSNDASEAVDMNDPEFWTKCVGLTVPVEEEEKLGRRKARSGKKEYRMASDSDGGSDGEDRESEFEDVPSDDSESTLTDRHLWSQEEISNVAGALFLFGYGRWEKIRDKAAVGRALGDVTAVGRAMVAIMLQTEAIANAEMNMKKTRENKVCNKLFAMVISRERRERLKKEAAKKAAAAAAAAATSAAAAAVATTAAATVTSADSASTTTEGTEKTPSGVETPPVTVVEKPLATVTEKPAAADVAGGGQAAAPTPAATNPAPGGGIGTGSSNASGSISEGGSGGETSASIASISMTLPIIGSLAERATDEERKIAAASVCPPSESEFQANVKTALSFLLNKHHASRRALRDMRMAMAQSQGAKRKALAVRAEALAKEKADAEALVQAKAEAFGKAKAEALAQAKAEVAAQEKAGAAAERKSDSAAQANAEAAVQETGKAESKDEEQRNDEGKQEAGAEAGAGAGVGARVSDGDKAVGRAKAEVTKDGEKVDGKEERGDAVEVGAKAVAMASHAAMPGDGSSSGSGGSGGAPSATSHAAPAKKEEPVDDDLAVLNKVWKPRHVGPDSKFRSQNLVRISAKLSLLDEMEDLRVMMDSPNVVVGNMAEEVKRAPLPILHHVLDIWTDKGSQRKFLANHVYYVTANFELKDVLLSIKRYSPDQGALGQAKASEVLLEIFKSILREFGLEPSNLASGTTDSGSDIKAVSINGLWKQFGVLWNWCFCHLMVKTAEQAFGTSLDSAKSKNPAARDLLKTVIKVVETLSKSSNLRVKFEDLQVDLLGEVFKVKHAPQRWLSLTRTLERIIRLWHVLRRLYSDEGKNFPLEEGDNKDGILQLYSLLQPLSSIMRDGQYGGAPMTAEIFMKFAKLKTKVLDMSAPLRDIPALGEDGLPNPGEQRKALPSDMVPADKLHPMTTLAREKLCRALMSRLYERVWDEESPDPSFFCDAACLLTPPFIEGRHVSAMRLTAEDANYLPDGSKVIAPTADLEVTAKLDGAWTEIRKRTVEAVKTEQDRAGGSGAGGGGGPFKRARTSGGRSARRSTDPDEFADFGRTAGFQESGQDDVVEQEVGGEIMRYKGVFMKPQDPPFGIMMHSAPEGWRANHDRWLVQSACDLGWFTSMQKKRAAVIQDDPNNNWPGLISMPDHVFLGRRLKALVAKFRDDRRQALREAEKAREREQAKERRKLREENEARQKRDREVRQAQLVEERASLAVTAAAKASVASKERPLAPQPRDNSERANSVAEAQLQRLLAEQRGRAAVATAAAAAAAVRTGTVAPGGSGDKLPPLSHSQQQQGQMRVFKPEPTMVYTLPPNVDPSASNVRTVYDESGKLKGYMVWPSEDAAQATTATVTATTTATTATMAVSSARPEDRIRGLAGIVVPGVNGNPATANASAGVKPLLAGAEPPPPLQQQNQHQQQRGFERAFGGRPESGGVDVAPWGTSNPGPPAMVPAVSWNGHEGGVGIGAGQASASGPRSSLCVPLPVLKNNSTPAALATVNGFRGEPPVVGAGRGGAGAADLFKASVSTCDAAASTEDGILLRHAIHNLGVPISMLENYDSNNAVLVSMAASESPLRRALDMSWLKLANGNDSLSPSMAESIGVHLLSKAAAVAKDSFGLRLPRYDYLGPIPEKEKALLTAFLQSAAKATQLRASLLRYTQLREIQSFAARLVRAKELRNPTMPVWWKPELHDAHLLVASCIYGSSSDYGVQRAMREITAVTIRTHGSTVSEEKENSKIESAYALPGCATAEPMSPLCSMSPPLTAAVAKTRVKHLHSAAFVQAKRLHSSATVGNGVVSGASSNSIGSDRSVALGNGMVVAAAVPTPVASASPAPVIVINDNASVSVSGGEGKACLSGVDGNPTEEKVKMKRPPPEDVVEVLDLCGDDEDGIRERIVSESPMKKLKATPPPETAGETVKEAVVPVGVAAGEAVPPAASTPTTVPALSVSSTGSDSGSKGGAGEGDAGESPKGQKKGTAEAAVVAKEVTGKTKAGGTLDSFWNSP